MLQIYFLARLHHLQVLLACVIPKSKQDVMPAQALIKRQILRWARDRSKLTIEELAGKAHVTPDQLALWETTEKNKPTFLQAERLANALRVPLGYLFLSSPPHVALQIPDLRTVSNDKRDSFSLDFLDLLDETFIKQNWYRQYLNEQGVAPLPYVGRFKGKLHDEFAIATDITQTIGLTDQFRRETPNWDAFLSELIDKIEKVGILVLRSGVVGNNNYRKLDVEEFRGFVITDSIAPLIFINSRDARAAVIFTLAHELAHLWIGESGITNPDLGIKPAQETPDIERLCNRIAAEVLVPKHNFLQTWIPDAPLHENIAKLTKLYRVSSLVILKRALDLARIEWSEFIKVFNEEKLAYRKKEEKSGDDEGGGNFYNTIGARHNRKLIKAVLSSTFEGRESFGEAARMLGVKVPTLKKIATQFGLT